MSKFSDDNNDLKIRITKLKAEKAKIEASLTGNSPEALFRRLSMINYKIGIAEARIKGSYATEKRGQEFHVNLISNYES